MPDNGSTKTENRENHDPEEAALLSRVDIFARLDNVTLAQIASYLETVKTEPGKYLFQSGDASDCLYIVIRGSFGVYVKSSDGRFETRIRTIEPGEYFGETALLAGAPRSDAVRSDGEGELLRLPSERFMALLKRQPDAGNAVMTTLARRLMSVNQAVAESESAAVIALDYLLEELPPERRRWILQAAILDKPSDRAIRALFGRDASCVSEDLSRLGIDSRRASPATLRALRDRLDRSSEGDRAQAFPARAAGLLADAGCWDEALSVEARYGERKSFVDLLGRALRAIPPLDAGKSARWLERLSDDEAAADAELALARALLLEEKGQVDAASQLLMRSLGTAMMVDPAAGGRLMEALGRLSAVGSRSMGGLTYGIGARNPERSRPRGLFTPLLAGAAIVLGVAGGMAATGNPQMGLVLLLASAIVLWAVDLIPAFVVALGLLVSFVLFGLATPAQALAGFGTMDWFFVVAVFGIAEAVMRSGLLFRVGLLLVRRLPRGLFWQAGAMMLTGVVISPLLPFSTVRATLTAPLALAVAEASRLKEQGAAAAVLGMAAFIGAVPMGFIFLNGSAQSLLLWSLLPETSQRRFDPINWLLASLPAGIFVGLCVLAALFLLYRPESPQPGQTGGVSLQLAVLGSMSRRELAMIAVLLVTLTGWMFAPTLGLDLGTTAILGLIGAVITGNFGRQAIKDLDWNFLIFYGAILCVARVASSLGVDRTVAGLVGGLVLQIGANSAVFLLLVAGATMILKLVLMANQAAPLLGLALIPVASPLGIDPWLVAITILMVLFVWFPPSQNPMYLAAYSASEGRLYSNSQALRANLVYFCVALAAIVVSLPFWSLLGLL